MISSVDPKTSIDAFNRIAAQVPLFTTDSDAPASDRIAYIGSSNTDGRRPGRRDRREGAARMAASAWASSVSSAPTTRSSGSTASARQSRAAANRAGGRARRRCRLRAGAQSNVDDVLVANPEITCMVGFYSYNPPKIYEALQAAGKAGRDHRHRLRRGSDHAGRGPRRVRLPARWCRTPISGVIRACT